MGAHGKKKKRMGKMEGGGRGRVGKRDRMGGGKKEGSSWKCEKDSENDVEGEQGRKWKRRVRKEKEEATTKSIRRKGGGAKIIGKGKKESKGKEGGRKKEGGERKKGRERDGGGRGGGEERGGRSGAGGERGE